MNQDQQTAVSLGMMAMGMPPVGMGGALGIPSLSSSSGPTSSDGQFGSSTKPFGSTQSTVDNSGWTINFGNAAKQTASTGDRGGNALTPTNAITPASAMAMPQTFSLGMDTGSISPVYIFGGVVLVLVLAIGKKHK